MKEAILNHLANIKDLKVLSRTDVEIYRNSSKSREEIARELGVVNILEGSVYKVGNNFRLSVQLINAENGFHLWSDAIEGEYTEEIFAVQSRIAEQVANAAQHAPEQTGLFRQFFGLRICFGMGEWADTSFCSDLYPWFTCHC